MKTKAIVSGSFDPITLGHLDIIKRAASVFDEVYAVIFINSEKKYLFTLEQRLSMLSAACSDLPNVKVDSYDGLLAEYTKMHGIEVIVRGIRNTQDTAYEIDLAAMNRKLGNRPETFFLPSKAEFSHISSSFARDLIKYSQPLDGILPEKVIGLISDFSVK